MSLKYLPGQIGNDAEFVDKDIGNLDAEVIYSQYRDRHFEDGWGLRTNQNVTPDQLRRLFGLGETNRVDEESHEGRAKILAHNILDHFGAWELHCPELEEKKLDHRTVTNRDILGAMHKDSNTAGRAVLNDTVLFRDVECHPRGSTLVAPNRLALHLIRENLHMLDSRHYSKEEIRRRISQLLDNEEEYRRCHATESLVELCSGYFRSSQDYAKVRFTEAIGDFTQGVLRHQWKERNNVLAFSNLRTLHGRGAQSGGWIKIMTPNKPGKVVLDHLERSASIHKE